ncbi:MAG: dockerin type I repeat-containing protein, partial [Ruminococcus sp.]|nr:dockerin type I repeat-containing protein [Ruminococcus sp.]
MSMSAMPVVSNADDIQYSEPIPPYVQYTIDGDSVIFKGSKDYDFIVSGYSKFSTERTDKSFTITPTYTSTSFLISRVYMAEEIIDYDFVSYPESDIEDESFIIETHCHYFYPVIQNFAVTYNINTGTQVEYIGEKSYRSETNIEKIKSGNMGVCFDYFEDYDTDKICNSSDYYTLASNVTDNKMFFTFFDYGYEYTKKDKSVFCLKTPYSTNDKAYIDVSGNARVADTFIGGEYIDGNLTVGDDGLFSYTTIEPTSDGFVEVYCADIFPSASIILNVANGKFIPTYSTIVGYVTSQKCDLNMDGYINISDAVICNKYILGKTKLTNTQQRCADINEDGVIDVFDMVLLRQKVIQNMPPILNPEHSDPDIVN